MVKAVDLKIGVLYRCYKVKNNCLWVIKRLDEEGTYVTVINTLDDINKIEIGSVSNIKRISSSNKFVPYGFNEYIKLCK